MYFSRSFLDQTKEHAWGPKKIPLAGKKRIKVQTAPGPGLAAFGGDSSMTSQGQTVEMIWEGHNCYLVDPEDGARAFVLLTSSLSLQSQFVLISSCPHQNLFSPPM